MNSKHIVSLFGAAIVLIGCCFPVVNSPNGVSVAYMFSSGNTFAGVLLVASVLLGIAGIFRNSINALLAAVIFATLIFGFTWLHMLGLLNGTKDVIGLTETYIGIRAGGILIFAGLAIMASATFMITEDQVVSEGKPSKSKRRKHRLSRDNIHRKNVRHSRHSSSIFNSGRRQRGSSRNRSPAAK